MRELQYRDMTDAQMLEWGRLESAARHHDLHWRSLTDMQLAARQRRTRIGASANQAAEMVKRAIRTYGAQDE